MSEQNPLHLIRRALGLWIQGRIHFRGGLEKIILEDHGFRSKTWLLGRQTGDFIGLYEFDTVEEAEAYWDSLPLRMMKRRAAPGSLTYKATGIKESDS